MEAYVERMVEERSQLAERTKKLQMFLESSTFKKLTQPEQIRLYRQLDAMCLYLYILCERLEPLEFSDKVKPLESATTSLILGNPARSAGHSKTGSTAVHAKQVSKWIAEWSKETARPYQHTNAGWDESEVCAFVVWLAKKAW